MDKKYYALKGGCNLRFFMKSPRYSEDIDLDAEGISTDKLQDKVNGILQSRPFAQILQTRDIRIEHVTESKQTTTVQRWKLGLDVPEIEKPLPTKIEFSRRGMTRDVKFEAVDPAIIGSYELQPVMVNHYTKQIVFEQKMEALINRKELQARDTFDLYLLLQSGVAAVDLPARLRKKIGEAKEHVLETDFDMFVGQVLAYLSPEDQASYDREAWDELRLNVIEALESAEK